MKRPWIRMIVAFALPLVTASFPAAGLFVRAGPALAEPMAGALVREQRVTFAVENMTCALCPLTVRSAISRVEGVSSAEVDFEAKTAIVLFDPSVTTMEAIAMAATNAGYPAHPALGERP